MKQKTRIFERYGPHAYHKITMTQNEKDLMLRIGMKIHDRDDSYHEWELQGYSDWTVPDIVDQLDMQGYKEATVAAVSPNSP